MVNNDGNNHEGENSKELEQNMVKKQLIQGIECRKLLITMPIVNGFNMANYENNKSRIVSKEDDRRTKDIVVTQQ